MAYDRIKAIAGYKFIVACFFIGGIMSFFMLHPKKIEKIRCEKRATLVDVRERERYEQYHYKNTVNIPYSQEEWWVNQFCENKIYILFCEYGNVSLLAARRLSKKGITAYTVIGGINAWQEYVGR